MILRLGQTIGDFLRCTARLFRAENRVTARIDRVDRIDTLYPRQSYPHLRRSRHKAGRHTRGTGRLCRGNPRPVMSQRPQPEVVAALPFRTFLFNNPAGVRRGHAPALGVVLVRPLKNWPKVPAARGGNLGVFVVTPTEAILACAVEVMLVRHILPETVLRGVLVPLKNQVVVPAVEIDALLPCHLRRAGEQANPQLHVVLGSRGLLTLAGRVNDHVRNAAVPTAVHRVPDGLFEQLAVVAKHGDRHLGL